MITGIIANSQRAPPHCTDPPPQEQPHELSPDWSVQGAEPAAYPSFRGARSQLREPCRVLPADVQSRQLQGSPMTTHSRVSPTQATTPSLEPVPNWTKLSRNDEIEVYEDGKIVASGTVDMMALDGSLFWLLQDSGKGRALFLHGDGLLLRRHCRPRTHRHSRS